LGSVGEPYDNCSFSIYKNNDAIATAGKTSPTSGTRIDGRFKLIISFMCSKIYLEPMKGIRSPAGLGPGGVPDPFQA